MDTTNARSWVVEIAQVVEENKDYLTHLDSAIGDADHGVNLSRGFSQAAALVTTTDYATPGALLTAVGNTLISKVGGASGPLYGTAFRKAGKAMGDTPEVDAAGLGRALEEALTGVTTLGASAVGDKTMVDALDPAVAAYRAAVGSGASLADAMADAAAAADEGAKATIPLQALKGRASYLGPRSVGHQDPGATSTALLLGALRDVLARPPA